MQKYDKVAVDKSCARFKDDEFPGWWYSPARTTDEDPRSDAKTNEEPRTTMKINEENEETNELRPPAPTVEPPIGRGSQRPPRSLQSDSLHSDSRTSDVLRSPSSASGASAFTEDEVNLLASNKVYRSPESGEWFHREEYPDGRLMITPVNPNAELRRLRGSRARENPTTLIGTILTVRAIR